MWLLKPKLSQQQITFNCKRVKCVFECFWNPFSKMISIISHIQANSTIVKWLSSCSGIKYTQLWSDSTSPNEFHRNSSVFCVWQFLNIDSFVFGMRTLEHLCKYYRRINRLQANELIKFSLNFANNKSLSVLLLL